MFMLHTEYIQELPCTSECNWCHMSTSIRAVPLQCISQLAPSALKMLSKNLF